MNYKTFLKKTVTAILCVLLLVGIMPVSMAASGYTVSFCLIGAEFEEDGGDYVVWIPEAEYTVTKLDTVGTLLKKATAEAGLTLTGLANNYISAITAPEELGGYELAEFTNGQYSGWMYTIDGLHPGRGVNARYLKDGNVVVFHYVNDYRYEVEDWSEGTLGTEETWNKWLEADDSWLKEEEDSDEEESSPDEEEQPSDEQEEPSDEQEQPEQEEDDSAEDAPAQAVTDITEAIDSLTVTKANAKTRKRLQNIEDALNELTEEAYAQVTNLDKWEELNDQFADLLEEAAEETAEELEDYVDDLDEGDATEKQRSEIEEFLEEALDEIDGADDTDEIDEIYDDAKAEMKQVLGEETEEDVQTALQFLDVTEADWFHDDVAFVVEEGLFNGTAEETFSPDTSMTRAMLVTVLYRLDGAPAVTGSNTFTDVEEDQWYTDAVVWAAENGIVGGYGNGLFGMNDNITREQLATILYRYAAKQLFSVSASNDLSVYTDFAEVSPYAVASMQWANAEGLINGRTADTLAPVGTATRAEVAAIIHRFAENF